MSASGHPSPHPDAGGLIGWFSNNHVAANILMFFLLIGGVFSLGVMRRETFPSIDPNLITVSVVYPGATPYEIEESITGRIEDTLQGIEGVKRIKSTASEGLGVVNVEVKEFADQNEVYDDVETAVNGLSSFPPQDAERPIVQKVKLTPNVMTLALFGEVSTQTLRHWADTIDEELRQLPGVSLTSVRGIPEYQISIEVSEERLRKYGMSLEQIRQRIRQFSTDIPAGNVESQRGEVLLRVQERKYTGAELAEIPLETLEDGSVLTLGDVAEIDDGFQDTNIISRYNGQPAAFIDVNRSESQDTIRVAEVIEEYLEELDLPQGLDLRILSNQTTILQDRISLMVRNALVGFVLVFFILLLFLDLKLAVWTSAAIPISFLGGMMILHFLGYSLNMISLFGLIIVLGIVVDDGIVVGESVFEEQSRDPKNPFANIKGVRSVIAPVTVGVLTTMGAFAPLMLSTGTLGQIIGVVPAVVIPILFVSLLEAYFILPSHLSYPTRWSKGPLKALREGVAKGLHWVIEKGVTPLSRFCIRWRYATLVFFVGVVILGVSLVTSNRVRFVFFPQIEGDEINISLSMPTGTPFSSTLEAAGQIEEAIETVRNRLHEGKELGPFESFSLTAGSRRAGGDGPGGGGGNESGSNLAEFTVKLVPSDYREGSASEIESLIREEAGIVPGVDTLTFISSLVGSDPDIEVELSHPDETTLIEAAAYLRQALLDIPGTLNVDNSFEEGKKEWVFSVSAQGLAAGLTSEELGRQLRAAYFGAEADRVQRGNSEVILYVRFPKDDRERLDTLEDTRIRLPDGTELPLGVVANRFQQTGFSKIETVDGRRVVSVTADADLSQTTPNEILAILDQNTLPDLTTRYEGLRALYAGETQDQSEDLRSLGQNMMIALLLIYVVLGAQLRSYIQPFIIMTSIPFAIVGAILGHYALGYDLTFISLFGVVALSGVAVNDSVVLMDYYNKRRLEGTSPQDSAAQAVSRRFRPIILTTMSTFFGLLPMLTETSVQARFLIPMVVSITMGILFCTVIILLVIPCLLMMVEDVKWVCRGCR